VGASRGTSYEKKASRAKIPRVKEKAGGYHRKARENEAENHRSQPMDRQNKKKKKKKEKKSVVAIWIGKTKASVLTQSGREHYRGKARNWPTPLESKVREVDNQREYTVLYAESFAQK